MPYPFAWSVPFRDSDPLAHTWPQNIRDRRWFALPILCTRFGFPLDPVRDRPVWMEIGIPAFNGIYSPRVCCGALRPTCLFLGPGITVFLFVHVKHFLGQSERSVRTVKAALSLRSNIWPRHAADQKGFTVSSPFVNFRVGPAALQVLAYQQSGSSRNMSRASPYVPVPFDF